ncbi:hypothetical protein ACTXT7_006727 [Hymenolepis weldensis]
MFAEVLSINEPCNIIQYKKTTADRYHLTGAFQSPITNLKHSKGCDIQNKFANDYYYSPHPQPNPPAFGTPAQPMVNTGEVAPLPSPAVQQ